ncbi:MAG: 16S rRNA (cytosine(1402)-N(4))-methyltransferase RsmH [Lachnospiraceae bacterium]|nr:16S rRNA (cytosine(1402)-N(4))-methyltransferase RsmH [Lachnospiraceae bacterium]
MTDFQHTSVLLSETIAYMMIRPDGIYLDGTLGGAGHSSEICKALTTGRLYGVDQDEAAIETASKRLAPFGERAQILRSNYENAVSLLKDRGVPGVDGILLDLGVSSYQFDDAERGFSYRYDAPLDMRMDRRQSLTAAEIVNEWPREEITRILREYGEEKFAANIARHIEERRKEKPVDTTFELNEIIKAAIPAKMRAGGGHPSKQTFQALRIACNRELEVLENSIDGMIDYLNPGGRLCIITFHSLEDRIVKNAFRKAENPCTCPPNFPKCVCGKVPKGSVITKKPVIPTEAETEQNPRAHSAKLRVFQKKQ